jgi:glycosyltransferase involved in cell wall biosynthesis
MSEERIGNHADPRVAIIIPTRNRKEVLLRCLRAIAAQGLPPGTIEVFVVDDGSTDGTAEAVAAQRESFRYALRLLRQQNAGPSAARNRALHLARAPLALILNDDIIVAPDCVAQHLAAHTEHSEPEVAVLGRVTLDPAVPKTLFSDLHLDATFSTFDGRAELGWRGFITCNLSLKRDFLLERGMFEESMFPHEDLELGKRLETHGLRVMYRPAALGHHHHHLTEQDFLRVAAQDGRALARWYKKEPGFLDGLFVLGLQGPPPLRRTPKNVLADLVIGGVPFGVVRAMAGLAARMNRNAGVFLYRRLYQYVRRRAIDREIRDGPGNATTAF